MPKLILYCFAAPLKLEFGWILPLFPEYRSILSKKSKLLVCLLYFLPDLPTMQLLHGWQLLLCLSLSPSKIPFYSKIVVLHLSKDRFCQRRCTQPAEIPLNSVQGSATQPKIWESSIDQLNSYTNPRKFCLDSLHFHSLAASDRSAYWFNRPKVS